MSHGRIEPSIGKVKSLNANSCKHIKEGLTTSCASPPTSGVYWVKDMQVNDNTYACMYTHFKPGTHLIS